MSVAEIGFLAGSDKLIIGQSKSVGIAVQFDFIVEPAFFGSLNGLKLLFVKADDLCADAVAGIGGIGGEQCADMARRSCRRSVSFHSRYGVHNHEFLGETFV